MNLVGEWLTKSGHIAIVERHVSDRIWIGSVQIGTLSVPTWWNEQANSINPELNLVKRRSGVEKWPASQ